MDFSLLPNFDQVAKYFGFTVYSGSANVDGIMFRYFFARAGRLKQ